MRVGGINESLSLAIYYDEHLCQVLSLILLELFHGQKANLLRGK